MEGHRPRNRLTAGFINDQKGEGPERVWSFSFFAASIHLLDTSSGCGRPSAMYVRQSQCQRRFFLLDPRCLSSAAALAGLPERPEARPSTRVWLAPSSPGAVYCS